MGRRDPVVPAPGAQGDCNRCRRGRGRPRTRRRPVSGGCSRASFGRNQAVPPPARGHRHLAPHRAHRGADDGEPFLRLLLRDAGSGRRLPAGTRRPPTELLPWTGWQAGTRLPLSLDLSGPLPRGPGLGRQSPVLGPRSERRVCEGHERRRHGLLDRRRHSLLLLVGPRLSAVRSLLCLGHGPDLSQPPVPHRRHGLGTGQRPASRSHGSASTQRDHLRSAQRPPHQLEELLRRPTDDRSLPLGGRGQPGQGRTGGRLLRRCPRRHPPCLQPGRSRRMAGLRGEPPRTSGRGSTTRPEWSTPC